MSLDFQWGFGVGSAFATVVMSVGWLRQASASFKRGYEAGLTSTSAHIKPETEK